MTDSTLSLRSQIATSIMTRNRKTTLLPASASPVTSVFQVESRIFILRHRRVILDADLAKVYGVPVKRLNEQVKRNQARFPADFTFQLTSQERDALRSQIATSNSKGGRRYLPYAFTEHGAIMAATVLNSRRAVEMSVLVVRAFVRLREMLATNRRLAEKIYELEGRVGTHDSVIRELIKSIKAMMLIRRSARKRIGFQLPARDPQKAVVRAHARAQPTKLPVVA